MDRTDPWCLRPTRDAKSVATARQGPAGQQIELPNPLRAEIAEIELPASLAWSAGVFLGFLSRCREPTCECWKRTMQRARPQLFVSPDS
jgi:hypothetical protein